MMVSLLVTEQYLTHHNLRVERLSVLNDVRLEDAQAQLCDVAMHLLDILLPQTKKGERDIEYTKHWMTVI
jgi:hypothetical protein